MSKMLMEAVYRSVTGPVMEEEKFETELLPSVFADIQKKYRIEWDPQEPVMADPALADAIFNAGKEVLLELGLYCKTTKRIVKFTEQEINSAIRSARHEVTLGDGREAVTLKPRAPGDAQHPYCFCSAGAMTTNVDLYKKHAMTTMQEPTCEGVIPLPLYAVNDMTNVADTPTQTYVSLTEARVMREAAAWAGKPGMWFGIPMSSTTPHTLMSTFATGLYNKQNCTLPVQILQDMRIDHDRLNLAFFAEQMGLEPWLSSCPVLYAYLTGPEQAAMEIIAHTLAMLTYSGGALTQAMSISVHGVYHGNDIYWCNSAAALAAERNLQVPWLTMGRSIGAGSVDNVPCPPLSEKAWFGTAIACINACISGMEGMWLTGGHTGIEARWAGEITRASTRLSPQEGIEIIKKINKMMESADLGPKATPLNELYDLKTFSPSKLTLDHYQKMTSLFKNEFGLDYPTWSC